MHAMPPTIFSLLHFPLSSVHLLFFSELLLELLQLLFCFSNHSTAIPNGSLSLEKLWQYLDGSSWSQWHALWIHGNFTLTQWSFTKQCSSYRLKVLVPKVNLLNSSIWASIFLRFYIVYNLIYKGRVSQGALFFLCSLYDNLVEMWYEISCMTSLSMANFDKTCRGFSVLYIRMKVKGVRHTNLLCRSMPPSIPVKCKVDPPQISFCTLGWQSGLTIVW